MSANRRARLLVGGVALAAALLVGIFLNTQRDGTPPTETPATATATGTPKVAPAPPTPTVAAIVAQAAQPVSPLAQPASPLAAPAPPPTPIAISPTAISPTAGQKIPTYGFIVTNTYPHDPRAFTQGLQLVDGVLYEGTGLHGESTLRRVDLATGAVLQRVDLPPEYFGEGIVVLDDRIIQLTWQSNVALVYDRATFAQIGEFSYPTEGWGLTFDGDTLIMSDGTATLYRRDPITFAEVGRLEVRRGDQPVTLLNELEYINGLIWANIWQTDRIAVIAPNSGQVVAWIDLTGLLDRSAVNGPVDVLNGIAYDAAQDRLLITGKWWPHVYAIRLAQPAAP